MAKMQSMSGLREIPLSQIVDNGNVRLNYREIEELAESIKTSGQLEPVLVKPLEANEDGIESYEIVAGHRRLRAIRYLHASGESFTTVKAVLVSGDRLTIQLIENLQRTDLTAPERERGIYQMCKNGLSQKEVAGRLSKPEGFVSRNVSAYKVRDAAQAAGLDTETIATKTLNEIQAAAPEDYAELVGKILGAGGTLEAARFFMEEYRAAHGKQAPLPEETESADRAGAADYGGMPENAPGIELSPPDDMYDDLPGYIPGGEAEDEPLPGEPQEVLKEEAQTPKKKGGDSLPEKWLEGFNPPHKQVDFNDVCMVVVKYAESLEIKKCSIYLDNEGCGLCQGSHFCEEYYKAEASGDIIALFHTEL
jgi:ParB/RepB/Spo0J family partition protein